MREQKRQTIETEGVRAIETDDRDRGGDRDRGNEKYNTDTGGERAKETEGVREENRKTIETEGMREGNRR